ncbi:MAG: hypothetical protein K9J28_09310 [Sulfuritalea sp.]|nr:hypothetical protein [Sulfuritalea sp.]
MNISEPVLRAIYNNFNLCSEYTDAPDAVIELESGKFIGIEITNIDGEEFLKYVNTTLNKKVVSENKGAISHSVISTKEMRYFLSTKRIAKTLAEKKNYKYFEYKKNLPFLEEIVLLIHSEFLEIHKESTSFPAIDYFYSLQTEFIKNKIFFDKVIYINLLKPDAILIFDKKNKETISRPIGYDKKMWRGKNAYLDIKRGMVKIGEEGGHIAVDLSSSEPKCIFS